MPRIFGKEASKGEFSTLVQGLYELADLCSKSRGCNSSRVNKELASIERNHAISEEEFICIADEADNYLFEQTPGRLTIPELRFIRDHLSQFQDIADILSKYGYSEADLVGEIANAGMSRYDWTTKILGQDRVDLSVLPEDLRNDKHFLMALIRLKPFIFTFLSEDEKRDPELAMQCLFSADSLKFTDLFF